MEYWQNRQCFIFVKNSYSFQALEKPSVSITPSFRQQVSLFIADKGPGTVLGTAGTVENGTKSKFLTCWRLRKKGFYQEG